MRPRPGPASPVRLIRRDTYRRTVFIRNSEQDRAPRELWDIICDGSDVVLIVEAPDEGFSLYGDRVVSWNDPHVTIDGLTYMWPDDRRDLRGLFET
jgi:hypothetical protein